MFRNLVQACGCSAVFTKKVNTLKKNMRSISAETCEKYGSYWKYCDMCLSVVHIISDLCVHSVLLTEQFARL
jgi:hypothetical protein